MTREGQYPALPLALAMLLCTAVALHEIEPPPPDPFADLARAIRATTEELKAVNAELDALSQTIGNIP